MSRIAAYATANNWPDGLALDVWLTRDVDTQTEAEFLATLAETNNIVACCSYANRSDLARPFVFNKCSLRDARVKLFDVLAEADESTVVDTAPRLPAPAADIWAQRRQQSTAGAELQGVWKARAECTPTP